MYKIAENDVLRVFVNVPQIVGPGDQERDGGRRSLSAKRPGQVYVGKVMGTTNYLDVNRSDAAD